jgi:BirA family biotin operon repressor/biotin-[acetyl-CoA-carboxylase] ligase
MGAADAFATAVAASGLERFTRLEHHISTRSTNDDVQRWLGDPNSGGLVIVADEQTGGKGRRGRRWVAPAGSGLLFTAILPGAVATSSAWGVTFWAALRVADALKRWNIEPTLQWPNDLLVKDRKLCGILCISRVLGDHATLATGIGINVHRPRGDAELDRIVPAPVFLDDFAFAGEHARQELLVAILRSFEDNLVSLHDPERIARAWERRAGFPGTRYRVALEDGVEIDGEALRIAPGGGLVLRVYGVERTIELADQARVIR